MVYSITKPSGDQWCCSRDFIRYHLEWEYCSNNQSGDQLYDRMIQNNIKIVLIPSNRQRSTQSDGRQVIIWIFVLYQKLTPHFHHRSHAQFPAHFSALGTDLPFFKLAPSSSPHQHTLVDDGTFAKQPVSDMLTKPNKNIPNHIQKRTSYKHLCTCIIESTKRSIPRWFRRNYVPEWNKESENNSYE